MAWPYVAPVLMLLCSNVFMSFAWYGQLKFPGRALWVVIPASWGIAFFEYCFAVPANRIGYAVYSAPQLKTLQEIITVAVFAVFAVFAVTYLGAAVRWNHLAAFGCLALAAFSRSMTGPEQAPRARAAATIPASLKTVVAAPHI